MRKLEVRVKEIHTQMNGYDIKRYWHNSTSKHKDEIKLIDCNNKAITRG